MWIENNNVHPFVIQIRGKFIKPVVSSSLCEMLIWVDNGSVILKIESGSNVISRT